jgi:hypothetical protein
MQILLYLPSSISLRGDRSNSFHQIRDNHQYTGFNLIAADHFKCHILGLSKISDNYPQHLGKTQLRTLHSGTGDNPIKNTPTIKPRCISEDSIQEGMQEKTRTPVQISYEIYSLIREEDT